MPAVILFIVIIVWALFSGGCATHPKSDVGAIAIRYHNIAMLEKAGDVAEANKQRRLALSDIINKK